MVSFLIVFHDNSFFSGFFDFFPFFLPLLVAAFFGIGLLASYFVF